jgi:hypothetical protein
LLKKLKVFLVVLGLSSISFFFNANAKEGFDIVCLNELSKDDWYKIVLLSRDDSNLQKIAKSNFNREARHLRIRDEAHQRALELCNPVIKDYY